MHALILILLVACSTPKKSTDLDTVSLGTKNSDRSMSINEAPVELTTVDKNEEASAEKLLAISLTLYDTAYSSLAQLYYFKALEEKEIKVTRIIATGLSVLVSALYADEKSVSAAEWKLFALLKKIKGEKIYSHRWLEIIKSFAQKNFKQKKISELKIPLTIIEYQNNELAWSKDGTIVDAIVKSVNTRNRENFMLNPKIFDHKLRELSSISHNHSIAFINKKFMLKTQDNFLWGLMTNYLSFLNKNQNITKIQSTQKLVLDQLYPMASYNDYYSQQIQNNVEKLKDELSAQNDVNSSSSF